MQPNHEFQQAWQQQLDIASQGPKSSRPVNAPPTVVEPASIIEWSAGLRCVMKSVAKHDSIINEIRRVCFSMPCLLTQIADCQPDDQNPARARRAVVQWPQGFDREADGAGGRPEETR